MNYKFQYKDYTKALYDALKPDPYYHELEKTIVGNTKEQHEGMLKYLDYSMQEAAKYGQLFTPPHQQYGASIWSIPIDKSQSQLKKEQKQQFLKEQLGDKSLATYLSISAFMSKQTENLVPSNSWYLSILGLSPAYQGQGLGGSLIKEILAKTDHADIPTFLETFTPRNISFYQRLGYKSVGQFYEPTVKADYWVMLRG